MASCQHIHDLASSVSTSSNRILLSSLFDIVAMTIRVGDERIMFVNSKRSISHRQIFVISHNGEHTFAISFESQVPIIESTSRSHHVSSHAILSSPGMILCFTDLQYVRFDARYGFHECKISEYTSVSSRAPRKSMGCSHLRSCHEKMEKWAQTSSGKEITNRVSRKVEELLLGSSPKKGALLEEGLLAGISAADLEWSDEDI